MLNTGDQDLWGLRICHLTGLKSGTVYPILARLEERGWATARWEAADPVEQGRPRRRFWSLTTAGHAAAVAVANRAFGARGAAVLLSTAGRRLIDDGRGDA